MGTGQNLGRLVSEGLFPTETVATTLVAVSITETLLELRFAT
jgi:hypothetical protein